MTAPFSALVPDARAFLADLSRNNTRDWFMAEKPRYDTQLKTPATHLLDQVAADIRRDTGLQLSTKLFRPQRDVRFSKDKTPYQTHLHMLWSADAKGMAQPALFFGISPEYVTLGGGVMGFAKDALPRWRSAVDGPAGHRIADEIDRLAGIGLSPRAPDLKRVPAPYDRDHSRGDLLRRKGLSLWRELNADEWATPETALVAGFAALRPLLDLLAEVT